MTEPSGLSEREIEILKLVATGAGNKQIALNLSISPNTVKVHLKNIFNKIGAASRTEAALYAIQAGLVPAGEAQMPQEEAPLVRAPRRRLTYVLAVIGFFVLAGMVFLINRNLQLQKGNSATLAASNATLEATRWRSLKPMPSARASFASIAFEDHIYALGGETEKGLTGVVESYDPKEDQWELKGSLPVPLAEVSAALIGGKIYIPGGKTADGKCSNELVILDPVRDEWSQGAHLPEAVCGYGLVSYEGQLYLFGGWDGKQYLDSIYLFSPQTNRWQTAGKLTGSRAYLGAVVAGGKIILLGGKDGSGAVNQVEVFQPTAGANAVQWTDLPVMAEPLAGMGVTNLGDLIFVIGGSPEGKGAILEYSPANQVWANAAEDKVNWLTSMGVIGLDTNLYIFGGKKEGRYTSQAYSYQALYTISLPLIR